MKSGEEKEEEKDEDDNKDAGAETGHQRNLKRRRCCQVQGKETPGTC